MTGHGRTVDSADESRTVELEDSEVDTTLASRATVYGLLVRLFDEPDERVHEAIDDGSLSTELATLVVRAGLEIDPPQLEADDDLPTLKARFNDIFEVGVPKPPVPLYESSHRDDVSWHDLNLDLARAYDYYGLDVDDSNREDHDNLRLQLEFASYLARREAIGDSDARVARRDFLDRHLTVFTQQLRDAIESEPNTGVYGDFVEFLEAFVTAEHRELASTDQ